MNANKLTYLLAIGLSLLFVGTGCKHHPQGVTKLPDYGKTRPNDPGLPEGGTATQDGDLNPTGGHPLPPGIIPEEMNQDRVKFAAETVHFAYDSHAIQGGDRSKIETVAAFMKGSPPNVALLVEGHCDERGTEEYNRALGEHRALAVREALISAGADGQRIVTRSYGKDRKIDTGNSDAAHARNRRGEFVVLTPK